MTRQVCALTSRAARPGEPHSSARITFPKSLYEYTDGYGQAEECEKELGGLQVKTTGKVSETMIATDSAQLFLPFQIHASAYADAWWDVDDTWCDDEDDAAISVSNP